MNLPVGGVEFCVVGPMVGRNPGAVPTQGEMLADGLAATGYRILAVSSAANRYRRLLEILSTLMLRGSKIPLQLLQVYGGPSFVVEDLASFLGRRLGQRVIMHVHGGAMPEFMARHPAWTQRVFARADAIVTPSPYLQRALRRHGFEARVIPNVVNLDRYPFRVREPVRPRILWMRTLHPVYNPGLAVRALAELRREVPEARLTLAGADRGLRPDVERLMGALGLVEAVRFPGFLEMAAKVREGNEHDLFLSTSRVDNMPVSLIEAMAMGLPVVATAVGGVPDMIEDGRTGLLVPDDDASAVAAAVRRLLREAGLGRRIALAARALAEEWSWQRVQPLWEALLRSPGGGH